MDDDSSAGALGSKTRSGISWNLVGAVAQNVTRLISVVVLGRLLTPADFGVVAGAVTVLAMLKVVRDLGVGAALVQRRDLEVRHIKSAFAITMYFSVGVGGLLAIGASKLGDVYGIERSVPVLQALAIMFAARGVSTVSLMLASRKLAFRMIALAESLSYALGVAVSVGFAIAGAGQWSLVAGYLAESLVNATILIVAEPPRIALVPDRQSTRDLLAFGAGHTFSQAAHVVAMQGDNLVVGHSLGEAALGFYSRAYDLVRMPANIFTSIVGSVLFPAFSRMQDDKPRLRAAFMRTIFANALILLPATALLIVLAPELIELLMGPNWDAAVLPFQILAIGMLARTSQKAGMLVARAAGDVHAVAIVMIIYALAVVVGAGVTSRWGLSAVSISTCIAIIASYVLLSYLGMRRCDASWLDFFRAHGAGTVLGSVVGAATFVTARMLRGSVAAPAIVVCVSVVALAVSLGGLAIWFRRGQPEVVWLWDNVRSTFARKLRTKKS